MSLLKDDSPMPYGKYAGIKMANVPASYLLWCHRERKIHPDVDRYVFQNMDTLIKEEQKEIIERQKMRDCDATESDIY
jgi:uncharacterized protein (DUF3820 family)